MATGERRVYLGIGVARKPDEAARAGPFRRLECLDRPVRPQDLLDVIPGVDCVHLPEVDVVSRQETEGGLQVLLRALRRAFLGLGREEDILPDAL